MRELSSDKDILEGTLSNLKRKTKNVHFCTRQNQAWFNYAAQIVQESMG